MNLTNESYEKVRSEGFLHQVNRPILIFLQGKRGIPGNSRVNQQQVN